MKGIAPSHTRRGPHAHAPRLRCVRHSSIEKPDYPEFSYSPWLLLPDPTPNAPPLSLLKGTANAGASQTSLTNAPLAGSSQSPRGNAVHKRGAAHIAVKPERSPRRTPQFASNLLRASPHIATILPKRHDNITRISIHCRIQGSRKRLSSTFSLSKIAQEIADTIGGIEDSPRALGHLSLLQGLLKTGESFLQFARLPQSIGFLIGIEMSPRQGKKVQSDPEDDHDKHKRLLRPMRRR